MPLTRSEVMSRIRSRDTKPELAYARDHPGAFSHPEFLPFNPDFAYRGRVVFVDSDFWHCTGRINWARLNEFWQAKLLRNLCRDLAREAFYRAAGDDLIEVI